jgi:hypothetical protein
MTMQCQCSEKHHAGDSGIVSTVKEMHLLDVSALHMLYRVIT